MSSRAGEPTWTIGFALMPLALKAARAASTMRAARRQSFARCTRCFGPTPGATHSKSISRSWDDRMRQAAVNVRSIHRWPSGPSLHSLQ